MCVFLVDLYVASTCGLQIPYRVPMLRMASDGFILKWQIDSRKWSGQGLVAAPLCGFWVLNASRYARDGSASIILKTSLCINRLGAIKSFLFLRFHGLGNFTYLFKVWSVE